MENYLYFAEADVETGGDGSPEAITIPASSYLYADPSSATVTNFFFKNITQTDHAMTKVTLTHASGANKSVIKGVLACVNAHPSKGGFVIVANANAAALTTGTEFNKLLNGDVTGVSIAEEATQTNNHNVGVAAATGVYNGYGAGALSTEIAPLYRQVTTGTEVVTEILVDLTGLKVKGSAANDVIGLGAGGAAFIGNYIQATMGLIYKVEVVCLEVPGQASGTITTDIDIAFNTDATLAFDGAAGTAEVNTGGFAAVGASAIAANTAGAMVPGDQIYLVEGDTVATNGVFSAGKLLVRLHGSTLTF